MKNKNYNADSTITGALATGRLGLLFFPDKLCLNFEQKEFLTSGLHSFRINLSDVIDIDMVHRRLCVDLALDTIQGQIVIRCLKYRKAIKIKHLIESYIWKKSHENEHVKYSHTSS